MKTYRVYKDPDNRWYIDLPEWIGSKSELEMVAGADTMLNFMSEDQEQVWLTLSIESFSGCDNLTFVGLADELQNGAYYHMSHYRGWEVNIYMWLCDVTKFVFGEFPPTIYLSSRLSQ